MAAIHDLIAQIGDERLRERLSAEWARATRERKFGLVFEEHLPELLPLPKARPRKGDLVAPRGGSLKDLWRVRGAKGGRLQFVRPQTEVEAPPEATAEFEPGAVMVVREFGEPIFPALMPVDAVANGGADAAWHTLIEANNYHALQLLEYLYAGQVDCIYIDPPYNTGARDWKYNNDYVDGNDAWRHSKRLAFMERRLRLARKPLNPARSILIIAIDDNELCSLGMLLSDCFREEDRQLINVTINPKGKARDGRVSQVDEYLFVVYVGAATDSSAEQAGAQTERWPYLRRGDVQSERGTKKGGVRHLNAKTGLICRVGEALTLKIPYETGGEVRPMFPDFVVVRTVGEQYLVDILEPHDPSRDDNVDKARALARFAERHGALFGRIQLIRKRKAAGCAEQFVRLEINRVETIQSLLFVNQASQLDALFDGVH
jgi:adenine-specific DNA-methyltransferase